MVESLMNLRSPNLENWNENAATRLKIHALVFGKKFPKLAIVQWKEGYIDMLWAQTKMDEWIPMPDTQIDPLPYFYLILDWQISIPKKGIFIIHC